MNDILIDFEKLIQKHKKEYKKKTQSSLDEYIDTLHSNIPSLFNNKSVVLSNQDKQILLNFMKFYKKYFFNK